MHDSIPRSRHLDVTAWPTTHRSPHDGRPPARGLPIDTGLKQPARAEDRTLDVSSGAGRCQGTEGSIASHAPAHRRVLLEIIGVSRLGLLTCTAYETRLAARIAVLVDGAKGRAVALHVAVAGGEQPATRSCHRATTPASVRGRWSRRAAERLRLCNHLRLHHGSPQCAAGDGVITLLTNSRDNSTGWPLDEQRRRLGPAATHTLCQLRNSRRLPWRQLLPAPPTTERVAAASTTTGHGERGKEGGLLLLCLWHGRQHSRRSVRFLLRQHTRTPPGILGRVDDARTRQRAMGARTRSDSKCLCTPLLTTPCVRSSVLSVRLASAPRFLQQPPAGQTAHSSATMAAPSKQRNRSLPQQLTLDHVSPATRLLEKRRHMFEVQEALDAQKEEFQRREATFKRREEMLKKKDLELQESLIKFNKFLQENDSKRSRAEKKRSDESKQKALKEVEIERLQGEVVKQQEKRQQMVEEVQKMNQYQVRPCSLTRLVGPVVTNAGRCTSDGRVPVLPTAVLRSRRLSCAADGCAVLPPWHHTADACACARERVRLTLTASSRSRRSTRRSLISSRGTRPYQPPEMTSSRGIAPRRTRTSASARSWASLCRSDPTASSTTTTSLLTCSRTARRRLRRLLRSRRMPTAMCKQWRTARCSWGR